MSGQNPVGLWADALAAVEEAQIHNYSSTAAFSAAIAHLEDADRDQAVMIAALLASWIAFDLNKSMRETPGMSLGEWVTYGSQLMARRQAGS